MDTLYKSRVRAFANMSSGGIETTALTEESILSLLVVLGSSVSLVALVFAFITYSLFSDLRNLFGTTLMNLLAALFMCQLLYVVGVGGVLDSELCIALAFALQYARICVFCWLLLITHNMHSQFRTGLHLVPITDNNITGRFLRYSAFGWGTPLLLLVASVGIQYHDKGGKLFDTASLEEQNCWFLDRNAFIYSLLMPCCILIASTFYYLVRSGILARYIISIQDDIRVRESMKRKRSLQILLFTKLTILLSTVLVLSACSKLHRWPWAWASFHAAQGLQGILSASLVACDCRLLKVYTRSVRTRAAKHVTASNKSPNIDKSASMQMLTWEPLPDAV